MTQRMQPMKKDLSERLNTMKAKALVCYGGWRVRFLTLSRPKQIAIVVVAIAILGAMILPGPGVKVKRLRVETLQNYQDRVTSTGKIRPSGEVFLSLNKGGRIDRVLVKEGEAVAEGQIVAVVDENIRTSALKSALSAFKLASRNMSRIQTLLQQGAATPQEVDETRALFDNKRAELENAKTNLVDGVIRSPISGRLSVFVFQVGDRVPDGSRVGVVQKVDAFEAIAKYPFERREEVLGERTVLIHLDERTQRARGLTPEQATFTFKAMVTQLSQESDFDGQNVDVRIQLGTLPENLKVSDSVEITVVTQEIPEVKTVASSAVKWRDRKPYLLFLEPDGLLAWRSVRVGSEVKGQVPIWGIESFEGFVDSEKAPQDIDKLIKKQSKAKLVEAGL